jgi:hypothetical protein
MATKQTASGGRSTSERQSKADTAPKTTRKASERQNSARDPKDKGTPTPKTPSKSPARPRAEKSAPAKPRQRVTQRPVIEKRPGIAERFSRGLRRTGGTLQDPAFWQRVAGRLPPWLDEVGALALIVAGVVMLTALFNSTSEATLAVNLSHTLRQIFGNAAHVVSLAVVGMGVILLLPKFGIRPRFGWTRTLAIETAFGAFTALLHLLANDPEAAGPRGRRGRSPGLGADRVDIQPGPVYFLFHFWRFAPGRCDCGLRPADAACDPRQHVAARAFAAQHQPPGLNDV